MNKITKTICGIFLIFLMSIPYVVAWEVITTMKGKIVNSQVYVDHYIHMLPPQDVYRCYEIKEHSSSNCHKLKKPVNADKLPYGYWVH